jgi:hypothetical protein
MVRDIIVLYSDLVEEILNSFIVYIKKDIILDNMIRKERVIFLLVVLQGIFVNKLIIIR